MKSFRDLRVWQESIELAVCVFRLSEEFPRREHFGLASQMRKAVVSVASNVAEGQGRRSKKDWVHFLSVSRGSLYELETQLVIADRLGYIAAPSMIDATTRMESIRRGLQGLMHYLTERGG
jgi:four helix bundle protein